MSNDQQRQNAATNAAHERHHATAMHPEHFAKKGAQAHQNAVNRKRQGHDRIEAETIERWRAEQQAK